ncbi:MAG: hypothetical protein JXQ30_16205 [Spirochaetes bacterium]|nr:hypothetical protein [Spirochaetota bacterium]
MSDYRIEENIETGRVKEDDRFFFEHLSEKGRSEGRFVRPPLFVSEKKEYLLVSGSDAVERSRSGNIPIRYGFVVVPGSDRRELVRSLVRMKRELYGFNHVEKALALKSYNEACGEVDEGFLSLLDIPKSEKYIQGYLSLAEAPGALKELVVTGEVDLLTAFEIFSFEREHWDAAAGFISKIKLGTKKRNRILSMIRDIALRDGTKPERIMGSPSIRRILALEIDPPHKGQKVSEAIEQIRYPEMTAYVKKFYERLRKVDLDPALTLTVPQDFEQWRFSISFTFSSIDEFEKKTALLERLGSGSAFGELLGFRY